MKLKLLNYKTVALIAVGGTLATWLIYDRAEAQSRRNEQRIEDHRRQMAESLSRHAFPVHVTNAPAVLSLELARLTTEREMLRNEISNLQSALEKPPRWGQSSLTRYTQHTNSVEEVALTDAITAGKKQDVQTYSRALNRYLGDHKGQFPSDIGLLGPYLSQDKLSLTGTNQFDIVYTGTTDDLTNFPLRSVAMLRERQPWLAPDGRWTRVYGMYGGNGQFAGWSKIVPSDDGFAAFESEFVVTPDPPR